MKNLFKAFALTAMIMLSASCIKEDNIEPVLDGNHSEPVMDGLRRYTISFDESTKTELSGSGSKRSVKWNYGDVIDYYTEDSKNARYATVSISGDIAYIDVPRGRTDKFINAVYRHHSLIPVGELTVGDAVNSSGVGIVGAILNNGSSALLVSATEIKNKPWAEANEWCNSYGDGWRMPTIDELTLIHSNISAINSALSNNGYTTIATGNICYWSSTVNPSNSNYYYRERLNDGLVLKNTGNDEHVQSTKNYTRAVLTLELIDGDVYSPIISPLHITSSTESTMYVNSPVKNDQSYTSFSEVHICAAFSNDLENPNLQFHNAASILKFTSSSAIHKVVFSGNNGEIITGGNSGDLKIDYSGGFLNTTAASTGGTSVTVATNGAESDFYIAIIPVNFSNGISVNCYDADDLLLVTKKTGGAVNTVSSNGSPKVINLGNVQDWLDNATPIAVDLGLSVKWASFNIGANMPEGFGSYFSWGETEPKNEYKWSNYKYSKSKNGPFSKYVIDPAYGTVDHKTILDLQDDVAHANWGGSWRMPSKEEYDELKNNCTWTWTQKNGITGYCITSKVSGYTGNSIFLPANGMMTGTSVSNEGSTGNYWSSSLYTDDHSSWSPYFSSSNTDNGSCYRYFGLGVRPVQGAVVPVSGIDVSPTLKIDVGKTATLSASVQPANATYKNVTWSSSDESIATVDAAGKVTAVSIGKATVTAYSADAATTGVCEVTVMESATIPNGHEYVNLGLPSGLKWATMNVRATKPEEYGDHFAWGETQPKDNYTWSTYKWCNGAYNKITKYCTNSSYWDSTDPIDNKTVLDLEDDAAHVNWGGSWRMPTEAEWTELRENCTWTWTTQNGVNGLLVTSKTIINSNSIFLPAAGGRYDTYLGGVGSSGYYWSSSLITSTPNNAWRVFFHSGNVLGSDYFRYSGRSVRPVTE